MQCHGGMVPLALGADRPIFTIGSGPVGGLIGCARVADDLGRQDIIASDMGGTSFDVGIIKDGEPLAADDTEGAERGRQIRDFHPDIKGTDHRGERYHALDPDVFWWAHATFTWEFLRARELFFVRPLSRSQREQLYAETVTWYRRYGVSERPVPPTLRDFRIRFDEICRTELELTPAVQWVISPSANPSANGAPIRLPGPLSVLNGLAAHFGSELLRVVVYGSMPDVVRRRFDLPWSHSDRLAFAWVCAVLRGMEPTIALGALSELWPEGTPHPAPGDLNRIVISGPNLRQRNLQRAEAAR
jgi:hypothetical protein